jgi:hypothetical protein
MNGDTVSTKDQAAVKRCRLLVGKCKRMAGATQTCLYKEVKVNLRSNDRGFSISNQQNSEEA